jgi:trehalose 2-sulfotransferase
MNDRGFAICSYPRSGTNLLCRAMEATGKLGSAQEFFHPRAMQIAGGEAYPLDSSGQVAKILTDGRTANGIYGVKLFCDNFDQLYAFDWVGALPNLQFVHLERRDILRQAISCVRAKQTGQWHAGQAALAVPQYDHDAIQCELIRFARDRARWMLYFARNDITPLWLVYEDMVQDLSGSIRRIAATIGVDNLPHNLTTGPDFTLQRGALTEEWRHRYLSSARDCTFLEKFRRMVALQFHKYRP